MKHIIPLFLFFLFANGKPQAKNCQDDYDCEYNGECVQSKCECFRGWKGDKCQYLNLLPAKLDTGYHRTNVSSWGGSIYYNKEDATFHMWLAEMDRGCGLTAWQKNSLVRHAVSDEATGPYIPKEVAIPVWSHNPHLIVSGNDLLLFHIGNGEGKAVDCPGANGTSQCGLIFSCTDYPMDCETFSKISGYTCHTYHCSGDAGKKGGYPVNEDCGATIDEPSLICTDRDSCMRAAAKKCDENPKCDSFGLSSVWRDMKAAKFFSAGVEGLVPNSDWAMWVKDHKSGERSDVPHPLLSHRENKSTMPITVSQSVEGPWIQHEVEIEYSTSANNPAPYAFPNGTVLIAFNDGKMSIAVADSWKGPYRHYADGACGGGEDPNLYVDKKGRFHCLYHAWPFYEPSLAIAHAYSLDGKKWTVSPYTAAGSTITFKDNGVFRGRAAPSSKQQIPSARGSSSSTVDVVFAKRERPQMIFDQNGDLTHLITPVCINPQCDPWRGNNNTDPECRDEIQYKRCDINYLPQWFDYTFTVVQELG